MEPRSSVVSVGGGLGGKAQAGALLNVVGYVLRQRAFSAPLPFNASSGQTNFLLSGPTLPPTLSQFQEALDVALENLPGGAPDWERCSRGDAMLQLMVKQVRTAWMPGGGERFREEEPDPSEVFMDLPHHDDYWPGATYFAVSDAPWRTLFYPDGAEEIPTRFQPGVVIRYNAVALHSAPGFCAASSSTPAKGAAGATAGDRDAPGAVLRTFIRILAWDPVRVLQAFSHFAHLLGQAPAAEWSRPETCKADDVIPTCFDAMHPCERCCDLRRGPLGDAACWAGWLTYEKCCGPASRRWAGCGWRTGADLFAHDYYSLQPPRLHSAAQCQQRCTEEDSCGGFSYYPPKWEPMFCRLPVAAILGLRRVCILRRSSGSVPLPHQGVLWGPRDCDEGAFGCLVRGMDRIGTETAFHRDVADVAACRQLCQDVPETSCRAFLFFPDDYRGDASEQCQLSTAVISWWQARCLMKTAPTDASPGNAGRWYMPMPGVITGGRGCSAAQPWALHDASARASDAGLAVDGDYSRSRCSVYAPWRFEFDARYSVSEVKLFTGGFGNLLERELVEYEVYIIVAGGGESQEQGVEEFCGSALEREDGLTLTVDCSGASASREGAPAGAQGVAVRAAAGGGDGGFSVCEVELQVHPVPCKDLAKHRVVIHAHEVYVFEAGEARRVESGGRHGQACERRGGSLVSFPEAGGVVICMEASCVPSQCLEMFDAHDASYRALSRLTPWDKSLEEVVDSCASTGPAGGQLFETTVVVHVDGRQMTSYWCFCAPSVCGDNDAATVVSRLASSQGCAPSQLPPGADLEIRHVRPMARWEDVKLDFLIAGFARSGTHSVRENLAAHPEVAVAEDELTFNWGQLPTVAQVEAYAANFDEVEQPEPGAVAHRRLLGGKGEGVVQNPRILRLLSRVSGLRLVVVVREPAEWLESLYNLRAHGCRHEGRSCGVVPSLAEVILRGDTFEDVAYQDRLQSEALEAAVLHFPPGEGRLLVLEFELLRSRPREFFNRLTDFLGISPFPGNFSFGKFGTSERTALEVRRERADLCSPAMRLAFDRLKSQLARTGEHARLARLIASAAGPQPRVSSRLLFNQTHCDLRRSRHPVPTVFLNPCGLSRC